MKVYDAASIRNVAVVGHGGCGKTQLVSAMLFVAGAVNRLGRVDDGTTVTDFDEEEIARKHTLSSSLAHAEWQNTKINIIDTPGFANFLTDARSALRVAEARPRGRRRGRRRRGADREALGGSRRAQPAAHRRRSTASSATAPASSARSSRCTAIARREIVPIQLPIGEERDFTGVVDLVRMKALTFAADGSGKMTEGEIPAALADSARRRASS